MKDVRRITKDDVELKRLTVENTRFRGALIMLIEHAIIAKKNPERQILITPDEVLSVCENALNGL